MPPCLCGSGSVPEQAMAGRGCLGAPTRTAAPAWLQREQSTLRGGSHLNAATWLQQQCPKRALGKRRRALSPGDVLWIMETRHLDGQQTCRRKEKGVDITTSFTHRHHRAPLQCGAVGFHPSARLHKGSVLPSFTGWSLTSLDFESESKRE